VQTDHLGCGRVLCHRVGSSCVFYPRSRVMQLPGLALDPADSSLHTSVMAVPRSVVEVVDIRDEHRRLRLSWHPELREVIVSHWRDNVCIATTPVGIKEIARLIGLLVQALEDAARTPSAGSESSASRSNGRNWRRLFTRGRRHLLATMSKSHRRVRAAETDNVTQAA
jgi:hypothetical protein